MENTEVKNKKLNRALIRCIAALLLGVLLLTFTGFSVFSLLKGPTESADIQTEELGAFVYRDVFAIMGFYAEDAAGDDVQGRYALVPMGGKLVTVRFSDRYLESAAAVCDNTYDYINGVAASLNKYVTVQGTVGELSEAESAIMYDWFGLNREQLVEMGVIQDTDDYADYLTDMALFVDTVGGYDQNLVIGLSIAAGALFLYMAVELVLMGTGFYLPDRKKAKAKAGAEAGEDEPAEEPEPEEAAPEDGEAVENESAAENASETAEGEAAPEPDEAAEEEPGEAGTAAEATESETAPEAIETGPASEEAEGEISPEKEALSESEGEAPAEETPPEEPKVGDEVPPEAAE